MNLTTAQAAALAQVRAVAHTLRGPAQARGVLPADTDDLIEAVRRHARVSLNFHPDRITVGGGTVAEGLLADGRYASQYVTGVSGGSRTAYPGGARDGWEKILFGGAYQGAGVALSERPVYGALNLAVFPGGAAVRFGCCHVRLRPQVNERCTFTAGDSHLGPTEVGTADAFHAVLAAVLAGDQPIGVDDPAATIRALSGRDVTVRPGLPPGRDLDDYVEAQVHGEVRLDRDVEAVVVDPSFRGTPTGDDLAEAAGRYGFAVEWHAGFALEPARVPDDFRGPVMAPLGTEILAMFGGRALDAATLGRAAVDLARHPRSWSRWGTPDEVAQYVKQLWHCVATFGTPVAP